MILIIGDGMGANHLELTRLASGGELLALQRLPYSGLVTTDAAEGVTDSAAAGTALACGVKTNRGSLAVSPGGQRLETILERSAQERKATGLVTTGTLWDSTALAFAVHTGSRADYRALARQLAESNVSLLFAARRGEGGGRGRRGYGESLCAGAAMMSSLRGRNWRSRSGRRSWDCLARTRYRCRR